jgi:hypothetical protein
VAWHPSTGEVTVNTTDISISSSPEIRFRNLDDKNRAQLQDQAFDTWREAEQELLARWDAYLAADRPSRRRAAFAAYLTALDTEAEAALALAQATLDLAAAA